MQAPTEEITIRDTSISGGPFTVHVLQSSEMQLPTEDMIRDTSISGSPFTVHVLQSPEIWGVVQYAITGVNKPWDVAASKNEEDTGGACFHQCISMQ